MKVAFFSTTKTDKRVFNEHLKPTSNLEVTYFDAHLNPHTALLAQGFDAICAFVNDDLSAPVLQELADYGIRLITLRCAGFNNIDRDKAAELGIMVLRVPAYSPMAVAEHAVALMMALNRKTHRAYSRVRDSNFTLEGLLGFDMFGKTAGVVGTGRIGQELIRILKGFGMTVLAYDPFPNEQAKIYGADYVTLEELYAESDIISFHVPLLPSTEHMINAQTLATMKDGVMIINTSRGALMQAEDLVEALKSRKVGYLGIDVYEQEENLFFEDHSEEIIDDDIFERLITFPNVLITAHQAFFTQEALDNISQTTLQNLQDFMAGHPNPHNCVLCER
ncbi:2-hydroxyacid dehydrogenase [Thiosulfativibrio zosterae]|uniref:Lactate dehydrogenase n=1 Tax=Thiosulfativibrio zosterae TaxID=2675053 RepID=A0A6F8PPI3_9GAMM|nr:2-hydroxyacid dehydrogenase [Thiosulfativibrio zosterae]BBP43986.1 lactate dehydrogenase [Thiosulfativibrio zosterae]